MSLGKDSIKRAAGAGARAAKKAAAVMETPETAAVSGVERMPDTAVAAGKEETPGVEISPEKESSPKTETAKKMKKNQTAKVPKAESAGNEKSDMIQLTEELPVYLL